MSELRLEQLKELTVWSSEGLACHKKGAASAKGQWQKEAQDVCEKHQVIERGPRQCSLPGHDQQHELCTRCSYGVN